jgi:hypothetical protein
MIGVAVDSDQRMVCPRIGPPGVAQLHREPSGADALKTQIPAGD